MTDRTRTCTLPTVDFIVCCVLIMVRDDKSIPWTVLSVYQLVGASATPLQSHRLQNFTAISQTSFHNAGSRVVVQQCVIIS